MASDNRLQGLARSREQRIAGLVTANRVRTARKLIKRQIAAEELRVADVLANPPADLLTFKVFDLLRVVPHYGPIKVTALLKQLSINPSKSIGGLSERQRRELVNYFGGESDLSHMPKLES